MITQVSETPQSKWTCALFTLRLLSLGTLKSSNQSRLAMKVLKSLSIRALANTFQI